jgi:arsenite methyltransferase
MLARFIARQLADPQGLFGRTVMVRLLNRGNDELISGTLSALDLDPADRFLDVGFGGGAMIEKAARVIERGKLHGVDRSADVVAEGRRYLRDLLHAGQLELKRGDVQDLPFEDGAIDKLGTTNTVYFWDDLDAGLSECIRVLAPNGRLAIGITGPDKMHDFGDVTQHGFTIYRPDELVAVLQRHGMVNTRVAIQYGRTSFGDYVVTGDKP